MELNFLILASVSCRTFLACSKSIGAALPLFGSQTLKLKLDCCIGIVSHDPSPSPCTSPTFAPNMAAGGRSLGAIWAVYLLAPNNERDQDFRLSPIYEGSCGHKKEPQAIYALGVWKFVASIRLLQLGCGCRGIGCRPARPDKAASSSPPGLFNALRRHRA